MFSQPNPNFTNEEIDALIAEKVFKAEKTTSSMSSKDKEEVWRYPTDNENEPVLIILPLPQYSSDMNSSLYAIERAIDRGIFTTIQTIASKEIWITSEYDNKNGMEESITEISSRKDLPRLIMENILTALAYKNGVEAWKDI
jgi:hypothetical protein